MAESLQILGSPARIKNVGSDRHVEADPRQDHAHPIQDHGRGLEVGSHLFDCWILQELHERAELDGFKLREIGDPGRLESQRRLPGGDVAEGKVERLSRLDGQGEAHQASTMRVGEGGVSRQA